MPEIRQCERCQREKEIVGVWCSILGAISFCGCSECLANGAEPYDMVKWFVLDAGGWWNLVPEFKEVMVFHDGEYKKAGDCIPEPTEEEKADYAKHLDKAMEESNARTDDVREGGEVAERVTSTTGDEHGDDGHQSPVRNPEAVDSDE